MDLLDDGDDQRTGDNAPEFTVSELSGAVKRTIEGGFSRIRVRGELGRVSRPRSGHVYLDLKDDRSVLSGVIWKGQAARLATQPEEGLEVVATGRLTTFPGQSKYQIVIDSLAPAGVGALMAMLEKRKKALEAEGLFASERKRPLPYLPEVIGVVTSPSGAVIRDILHRLRERFPRRVLIWPVAVQGERCAPEVARAIAGFNALSPGGALPRPDLLIVARGGGSIEDLWGFNDEAVARAAAASDIPLISAVGHETDTTLIDFVSDRRAPTPTAAAELAVPVRADLLASLGASGARLTGAQARGLGQRGQRLRDLARALPRPEELTRPAAQRLDFWGDRLPRALRSRIDGARLRLGTASATLRPATLAARLRWDRQRLDRSGGALDAALSKGVDRHRLRLAGLAGRLTLRPARQTLARAPRDLGKLAARLASAQRGGLAQRRDALAAADRLLSSLSYHGTLARGFAVVRADGGVVTSAAEAQGHSVLELEFHDGRVTRGCAREGDPGGGPAAAADPGPPRRKSAARRAPQQKTLFDD
ncbi:exodeoxyribonuclease VII large subunit [Meridianimarinicoccus roseus]|uniref:Exodeoxyribonuclease 7 large subunit n=1 Tax=Meridianimarinicoccus roseus TaxID=2072018 RepID=A0A2V2LJR8_9RHOB|nr:exodeoxyribonuclease VII large subunit [Meridianimarinicoccus roseus]PWR03734.1 exodeoxyribonuclease VII large subunit [Meridianimarinicoccus roseus]